jgi:hypothetical protein
MTRAIINISLVIGLIFFTALAEANEPKRTLANNMTEIYHVLPVPVTTISQVFTEGIFYGRLRTNYFYWENRNRETHDPTGFGLGGSVLYKTAPLYGLSSTIGLYSSQNLGFLNDNDALSGRAGKDTFSRYRRLKEGHWGMTVLAQAYLQYHFSKTDIKVGRQIFDGFLAKSNDTKMIPNTFEGYSLISKDLPDTTLTLAFFTGQKLRDHTDFHDIITYTDGSGNIYGKWNNQDDTASHKGLSYANLLASGKKVDNYLLTGGLSNQSFEPLKLELCYTGVPDLFYSIMVESNLKITLSNDWSLTPGLRYMAQFDDGAGMVGGAALNGSLSGSRGPSKGYRMSESVHARLYAARVVLAKDAGQLLFGYSKVSDDADFIAPWRAFPTSGYTRSMGEYNWHADTSSWMVQAYYDFGKADVIKGFRASIDYVYTDTDENKNRLGGNSVTDSSVFHSDIWYRIPSFPDLEAKIRFKICESDTLVTSGNDSSYREIRLEMNYLF